MDRRSIFQALYLLLFVFLIDARAIAQDRYQAEIPHSVALQILHAKLLREQGQANKSIEELTPIIARYSDYYLAYYNLALAYADAKEYPKAIESFKKALEIRERKKIPEASIFNSFGVTYIEMGDYTNAERMLKMGEQHIDLLSFPSRQKLFNSLGVLYLYKGNYSEAEKNLTISDNQYNYKPAKDNLKLLQNIKKDVTTQQKMQEKR